jgi:pimeloyl-ACP methyl ester carboxylesterase
MGNRIRLATLTRSPWKRALAGWSLSGVVLLAGGCIPALKPARSPMPVLRPDAGDGASECLVVFLPGRGGGMHDFAKAGFLEAAGERRVRGDLVAVDAHLGYYRTRSLVTRLREDVIEPAVRSGTDRVWLVGVSMGGLGSIIYARQAPDHLAGLVLLSPYLGEGDVLEEIRRSGGLRSWSPPDGVDLETDFERAIWQFLKENDASPDGIPIYLGYGADEKFASANRWLAEVLPPGHVKVGKGGHTWTTWAPIWQELVTDGFLCALRPNAP